MIQFFKKLGEYFRRVDFNLWKSYFLKFSSISKKKIEITSKKGKIWGRKKSRFTSKYSISDENQLLFTKFVQLSPTNNKHQILAHLHGTWIYEHISLREEGTFLNVWTIEFLRESLDFSGTLCLVPLSLCLLPLHPRLFLFTLRTSECAWSNSSYQNCRESQWCWLYVRVKAHRCTNRIKKS